MTGVCTQAELEHNGPGAGGTEPPGPQRRSTGRCDSEPWGGIAMRRSHESESQVNHGPASGWPEFFSMNNEGKFCTSLPFSISERIWSSLFLCQ